MSVIRYNNVSLPYAYTSRFNQEAVRDESDTDWHMTKIEVICQCVLNTAYLQAIAPDLIGLFSVENAADIMNVIRTRLLTHRKTLSVQFNGTELIPQPQGNNPGTVDAANGPKPQSCIITQLTNTTFLVTYHIIAHYWENTEVDEASANGVVNNPGNNVLFNRWEETAEIDDCNYTRRIRNGRFKIRSDNVDGTIADNIRSKMAVVGVPEGFMRESSHYTISPDGLAIAYRVTDKEVFKMPPNPAFKADGEYIESTTMKGVQRWGQVRVKLQGDRATDQNELIKKSVIICSSKLSINGASQTDIAKGFSILDMASIQVGMYENYVECNMRARMKPRTKGRIDGVAGINFKSMTETPLSPFTQKRPAYRDFGTAGFLLQAAAYYDPNITTTVLSPTGQLSVGQEVGTAGRTLEP